MVLINNGTGHGGLIALLTLSYTVFCTDQIKESPIDYCVALLIGAIASAYMAKKGLNEGREKNRKSLKMINYYSN